MQSMRISDCRTQRTTHLPDSFIEEVMPRANGDFVKIYIYLLSSEHHPERELSLSSIADVFSFTENDVMRALTYWAGEGLLRLEMKDDQLAGLILTDPGDIMSRSPEEGKNQKEEVPAPEKEDAVTFSLSADRIRALKADNSEVQQLLYVAESYLARTLSRTDIVSILYFYDTLHMSADLLEYLIEYCVMRNKTSIHYIQKVGLEWHSSGFTTVEEAKANSSTFRKEYFTVLKALGIANRNPVPTEVEYIDRWMNTYGFDLPLIEEACKRTVTNTGGSSFAYAEGILSKWKKTNVHTLKDVQEEDDRHQATRKKRTAAEKDSGKAAPNRFHNFHQRDYDYDQLEKDLLKQQW